MHVWLLIGPDRRVCPEHVNFFRVRPMNPEHVFTGLGECGPGNCVRVRCRLLLHDRQAFADYTQVLDHWPEQAHNILSEQERVACRRYGHLSQGVRDLFGGDAEGLAAGERMLDLGFLQFSRPSSLGGPTNCGGNPRRVP